MVKIKETYVSPTTETLEIVIEGIVCASKDGDVSGSAFSTPGATIEDLSGENWW